ncbi:hypothetical protein Fokcrypt_00004 [Candidatus Fokinia cryptica]|uniref:Uncharacterized protein n=1 Tax=Candidatus Fokinia crypta TaxID=1920990 RepID=A0ABZ0UQK5_9RICK|nr:hypothetical protein Fokcrypt_00004 [Candidatus Fokinia cryptica]
MTHIIHRYGTLPENAMSIKKVETYNIRTIYERIHKVSLKSIQDRMFYKLREIKD